MKIYLLIIFGFFAVAQTTAQCTKSKKTESKKTVIDKVKFENLPDGAKLDDEVRVNKFNEEGV